MSGKIVAGFIVVLALLAGASIYYLQVYAYYETVEPSGNDDVVLTALASGELEPIIYDNFEAITASSSPIRYRACFTTTQSIPMLTETYETYDEAEPLVAPSWFSCFDAVEIGEALERGEAFAFLSQKDLVFGVDRIVAVFPDGRGFVWQQLNEDAKEE